MFTANTVRHLARTVARTSGKTAFRALNTARFAPSALASSAPVVSWLMSCLVPHLEPTMTESLCVLSLVPSVKPLWLPASRFQIDSSAGRRYDRP